MSRPSNHKAARNPVQPLKNQGSLDLSKERSKEKFSSLLGWLDTLKGVQGRAQGTVTNYQREVARFLRDLDGEPASATPKDINDHLLRLFAAGAAPQTMAGALAAIRSYFDYLCISGDLSANPARRIRGPRVYQAEAEILTVGETRRLIYPSEMPSDPLEARAGILVAVSYLLGLRVAEPGRLRYRDLVWDRDLCSVLVRHPKRSSRDVRQWIYDREICRRLGMWLPLRDQLGGPALFPSCRGGSMCSKTAARDFAGSLHRRGIRPRGRHLSFHTLRHSLATHLSARGVSLELIRQLLRHADPKTTARYIHTRRQEHERLWRTHHPLERPRDVVDMSAVGRVLHQDLVALLQPG